MQPCVEAYLDIETTGLSPEFDEITVIGIHLCHGDDTRLIQLVGKDVTKDNVLEALAGVSRVYTYNGSRFDLPFIHYCLGISLDGFYLHHDLMYDCWRNNLYGGFKAVEKQLGITRRLTEITDMKLLDCGGDTSTIMIWKHLTFFLNTTGKTC